jgi:hypothetical protein
MADLRTFVLAARKNLIREAEEQLIQIYGLKSTGDFLSSDQVPALNRGETSKDALETYRRLKQLLKDEQEAGISPVDAIKKLAKEVAFTHLNRMVALKLLEGRKLIRGAINNWHNSNAFLFYLAEHEQEQKLFEQGSQPLDDRGEGPSDRAYRHFLLWQFSKLAEEIRVLFDPDNMPSRLFPRPFVLRALVDALNAPDLTDYWAPGNEETIGWVYQAFNSEELEAAFTAARQSGTKFAKDDIASVTQLFTPRIAVRFLVENSLGRMWVDMHPDTRLTEELSYLVPLRTGSPTPTMKPVREITLLDPATGTMHFGLVAFDWLAKMYREELENAGKPGWPSNPSVKSEEEIAAAIIANNLYGIDIDLRAVQLSALALYLRAKQLNKHAKLIESKLASADIAIFRGQHLSNIANEMALPEGVTHQLLSKFCESVDEAAQMGSLVRLEKHFQNIEAERLRTAIDSYVVKKAAEGEDESYFGNETSKGLRLLDLLTHKYDVVFTNPPYVSARKINAEMSSFMRANYPDGKGDLYAGFIQRCLELAKPGGYVAMLTMHSFMFIGSYEKLRATVALNSAIRSMAHFGPGLFAVGNPGTLQTTAFVVQRESSALRQADEVGVYFRLLKESDAQRKQVAFETAIECIKRGETDSHAYEYRQGDFAAIPGSPWVYWITPSLRQLFVNMPKLKDLSQPRVGLQTGLNVRFLRFWWESGLPRLERHCSSSSEAASTQKSWFPYMKGGKFRRWYGNQEYCVNWRRDGAEIRCAGEERGRVSSRAQNTEFYFRRGVTWSDLTPGKFSARLSPGGFIFDVKGSSAFPDDIPLGLGLLNSSFANYALNLINPTVSYQVGDLSRLPVPIVTSKRLQTMVEQAVELSKLDSEERETSYDFSCPPAWPHGSDMVDERHTKLEVIEKESDEEVYGLYGISDIDRKVIEDELSSPTEIEETETEEEQGDDEISEAAESLTQNILARQWVSYAVGIALGRFSPGVDGALGRGSFSEMTAERLHELSHQGGMMILEKGHPDDLPQRVWDILRAIQGDEECESIVRLATGTNGEVRESLEGYLLGAFFKNHVKQYRKRPVYWLLQSPNRTFSVYLFHERATANTLSTLQGNRYVGGHINRLETELADLLGRAAKAEGRDRTVLTKQAREIAETIEDLKAFDTRLTAANQFLITGADGLPKTIRWEPELDDGVLLNAAPLHELAPAWKKADSKLDLKKAWQELEAGKYDWAKTAMRYWPARVLKACKNDKSLAIAHGLA